MTGTIKIISVILLKLILSGCTKKPCLLVSDSVWETKCEKKSGWNNPGFTLLRTVITNGTNAGK